MKKQSYFFLWSILSCQVLADHTFLEELYNGKSGFCINVVETSEIENAGGNATYGEITDAGVEKLINKLTPTSNDVFYDLGSGIGRMATKMYLDSPVKKSVGIELSDSRHNQAIAIKKELKSKKKIIPGRILDFKKEDILKANLDDATIIYTASTCFSDEFMKKLTEKLSHLKKGLNVFTLRPLAKHDKFTLMNEFQLPMTWSNNVNVYWYQLQ